MRIIGVVDLLGGQAVHARGGQRDAYAPVRASAGLSIEGSAIALARSYRERFRVTDLYLADLDAIVDDRPQDALVSGIVSLGAPVWLDAGTSSVEAARRAADLGAAQIIVGLETLTSFDDLRRICTAIGSPRVAFSVDLRDAVPVARGDVAAERTPEALAVQAADAGAAAIVIIDLRRVGSGRGVDLPLIDRVRHAIPRTTLFAGGGIRTITDVERLAESGCDGVLLATALHDGTITAEELAVYV